MTEAGRELDALIAQHVYGYSLCTECDRFSDRKYSCSHYGTFDSVGFLLFPKERPAKCMYYDPQMREYRCSTDEAATWAVVRAMWEKGWHVLLGYCVRFYKGTLSDAPWQEKQGAMCSRDGKAFALAVCIAALRALDVIR